MLTFCFHPIWVEMEGNSTKELQPHLLTLNVSKSYIFCLGILLLSLLLYIMVKIIHKKKKNIFLSIFLPLVNQTQEREPYGPQLSVCTELKTRFLKPFSPYLLTEHLAHFLDGLGPNSQPDRASPIMSRSRDNAFGESASQASIGTWCKLQESHISHE